MRLLIFLINFKRRLREIKFIIFTIPYTLGYILQLLSFKYCTVQFELYLPEAIYFHPIVAVIDTLVNETCSDNNGGCVHSCTDVAGGVECSCYDGYSLQENHKGCAGKTLQLLDILRVIISLYTYYYKKTHSGPGYLFFFT